MVAAAASCAMHGNPVRWSSLPVVAAVACLALGGAPIRAVRRPPVTMRIALGAAVGALAWSAASATYHLDQAAAVAMLGGGGGAVLGFWIGAAGCGSTTAVTRLLGGVAAGYVVHAVTFLSWFVAQAGWRLADLMQFRWEPAAFLGAESVGFGNIGNNAVLAAMALPTCLCLALRPGRIAWRLLGAGASVLAVAVLVVVQARAPIAAAAAASIVVMVALRARKALVLLAIAGAIASGWVIADDQEPDHDVIARFGSAYRADPNDVSVEERAQSMREGWSRVTTNPLLGIGVTGVSQAMTYTSPHQWHLHQAIEWGIPAGIAWAVATLGILAAFVKGAAACWRNGDRSTDAIACIAMPATYFAIGCISGAQWHFGIASAWPTLCGLGFGAAWAAETRGRAMTEPGRPTTAGRKPSGRRRAAEGGPKCSVG